MNNKENELRRLLLKKLELINRKISEKARENPVYTSVLDDLSEIINKIKLSKTMPIISRKQIDFYMLLMNKINEFILLLEDKNVSPEDIISSYKDLKSLINSYLDFIKKEALKNKILMSLPVIFAFLVYLTNIFTLQQIQQIGLLNITTLIIGGMAVAFIFIRMDLSYIFLMLSAIIGLVQLSIRKTLTENDIYTGFIYVLVFITATTYLHTIKTVKSKEYLSKIKELASNIEKISIRKERRTEKEETIEEENKLYEKALELYKKTYGSNAEKLLNYIINIMVMHGLKRREALEKILRNTQT
ncbi:MAG: hypothetical protein J7J82_04895 [Staphylothermus sp.]|nr:hypothetical protein [Staphylothermus sp.]